MPAGGCNQISRFFFVAGLLIACMTIADDLEEELLTAARQESIERFVVAAVICRDGQVLLLKRRQDDFLGGLFELPGGVVEPGESLNQALAREVSEETGLLLKGVEGYLGFFEYSSGSGVLTRQFNFQISVTESQSVKLSEHDDFVWAGPNVLESLPVSDATREVVRAVL